MNALVPVLIPDPCPLTSEADQTVRVVAERRPFAGRADRVVLDLAAGLTLAEMVERAGIRPGLRPFAVAYIGEHRIDWERMRRVRPKAGALVAVKIVPGFGGDTGRSIAMLAVFAAAVAATAATAGLFAPGAVFAGTAFATAFGGVLPSVAAGLAGAAVSLAGTLAINALMPVQQPRLENLSGATAAARTSPTLSITGSRNRLAPYAPVPRPFGLNRVHPPMAARPYTEIAGEDQYLRLLFDFGYGPLTLTNMRIGEVDLGEYDDVTTVAYEDYQGETLTLYPDTVGTEAFNIGVTNAGGALTVVTAAATAEIVVDITLFEGLFRDSLIGGQLDRASIAVEIQVEYRLNGTADPFVDPTAFTGESFSVHVAGDNSYRMDDTTKWDWDTGRTFTVYDNGVEVSAEDIADIQAPSGVVTFELTYTVTGPIIADGFSPNFTYQAYTKSLARFAIRVVLPSANKWDVRITRITADNSESISNSEIRSRTHLTSLKSIAYASPVNVTGHTLLEMRIRATDQVNGVVDTFSAEAQAKLPIWNGASWDAATATRNPAWAALEVLRGSANARGWADANLDLAQWKAFADRCDEPDQNGEEKYRFDGVVDFSTTVFQVVRDILGTARADFAIRDGKASVVWDDPDATVVQAFTPKNSWGFKASRTYPRLPHALRVRFVNQEADWQEDEITVYDDGFTAANATRFETLELWGVTRESQAWREGRYRLAEGRLRPETVELQADIEHLVCQRGDLVRMTHDVMLWGLASGRIKSLTTDGGGNVTEVTLDEAVTIETGKNYGIVIRKGSDTSFSTHAVSTVTGEQTTLPLLVAIPSGSAPAVGEFVQFGLVNAETVTMKVKAILPGPDLTARLVCVDPADAVHTSDTGAIPAFDPRITVPPVPGVQGPAKPTVLDVKSDESVLVAVAGGGLEPRILVTLQVPANTAALERGEAQFRPTGTDQAWEQLTFQPAATSVSFRPVNEGLAYDLRLRYRSTAGVESEWRTIDAHTVVGKSTLPPDVPSALIDANRVITWPYPDQPVDFDGFRVRTHQGLNDAWASALPAHAGLLSVTQFDGATLPGGGLTVMIKGVDVAGNESANPAVLVLALGDPIVANVTESRDFYADGFPGTITQGSVDGGGDLVADAGGVFWSGVSATQFWQADDGATFWSTFYLQMTYVAQWAPPGAGQLTLALTVAAVGWSIEYRPAGALILFWSGTASTVFWTGDGEAFWSAQPAFQPWPGAIDATLQPYDFRLVTESGAIQGKVTQFTATVDVPDVSEQLEDVAISGSGSRLALTKSYQKIKAIAFDLQADGNGARSIEVADKDVSLGPLINAYNAAGAQVAATADFTVQGY